jgi:hypothetical protein
VAAASTQFRTLFDLLTFRRRCFPVAQDYIGPITFLPRPQRAASATITPTMPTTTAPVDSFPQVADQIPADYTPSASAINDTVYLPAKPPRRVAHGFLTSCVAVAGRAVSLVVRYKVELAPAITTSSLTALGWWQHFTTASHYATGACTALAVAGAAVAAYGLERKHDRVTAGGAALAVAFGDIAAAAGGGPGAMSLTATAVSTALAYGAYVPWLIRHRTSHNPITAAVAPSVLSTAEPDAIEAPEGASITVTAAGPFYDNAIPYQDDTSKDIADPIRIGWDENGQPVHLTLLYRHTLIAGAADWGKSGILNLIIKKLIRKDHVELYGIDLKPGTPELGPWAPLFKKIASTPEEARDLLRAIKAEGDRRGAHLQQLSLTELTAGREPVRKWIPGKHGTSIYVITDELGELIRQDEQLRKEEAEYRKLDKENALPPEPAVTTLYESGLAVLRFLAIHFIAATQQPSARVFGGNTDMRGNYANRISTRAGEAGHAEFVFGKGCRGAGFVPEKLTRPGEFFLQSPEMPQIEPPRCRAEWVSDRDIAADVAHLHAVRKPVLPVGRFAPEGGTLHLLRQTTPPKPAGPPAPVYPDGTTVPRDEWPDLYRVFCRLCETNGAATKDDLVENGPFASRDTARRAMDVWVQRGVLVRKAGRTEQFYLPDADETRDA